MREEIMGEPVNLGRSKRPGHQFAIGQPHVNGARQVQQGLANDFLQFFPQLIGSNQKRNVVGMLVVGKPDGSGSSGERGLGVGERSLFQPQNANSPFSQAEAG